ncbi:MAG TPA: glycosyltransferase family 2 protein [Actinomycetota bacterium]|nr:glycosyltransferase family 2 protein [Actinomycetota bacterium]
MTDPGAATLATVIVNYNTAGYLERCLASLERLRGDIDVDVLVIDNASHDGSHLRAVRAHPSARLIENPTNVYLSPAWNQGARETKAPWLLFLNPDTEWFHGTLADLVRVAEAHPRAGIVGPMIRNADGSVYPSGRTFPSVVDAGGHALLSPFSRRNPFTRRYEMDGWDRTTERVVDWVSGACMLMPRAAYDEVGGFDEGFPLFAEELDIATRLRDRGWHVLFTPSVEVLHEIGVSRGHSREILAMHSRSIYRYYRLHRARGWKRVTLPLARGALWLRVQLAWARGRIGRR